MIHECDDCDVEDVEGEVTLGNQLGASSRHRNSAVAAKGMSTSSTIVWPAAASASAAEATAAATCGSTVIPDGSLTTTTRNARSGAPASTTGSDPGRARAVRRRR